MGLPDKVVSFIQIQIKLHACKKKGQRYPSDIKAFALSLYHISGKAYKLLSKLFNLPSKSTLLKWVSKLESSPGFTKTAMNVISTKVKLMSESSKLCTIAMDEMSLKPSLFYESSKDLVVGVEDFGNGERSSSVANSALVFLARGVTENWKQPLCYYFVNESCPFEKVKEKLLQVIDNATEIGLKVTTVVSDLGSNFQQLAHRLKITPTNPYFTHKGRKIFYLYDTPHLIKAVRNNLMKYEFHFGDDSQKIACWEHIRLLYKRDSSLDIRCCTKLTEKHLNPNGFMKMKVKLATQVLSHTVSATMNTYVSLGALPPAAYGTVELINNFDQIFDCLNSSNLNDVKPARRAITETSKHHELLTEMIKFVSSITVIDPTLNKDVTNRLKCLRGLVLTLHGTLALWKELHDNQSLKFLLTRRLNQDPLENFFGTIRQQGRNSDNPTPLQFTRAFRTLFFDNILVPSASGNCMGDIDSFLVQATSQTMLPVADTVQSQPLDLDTTDYKSAEMENNVISMNAITYVAGYLLRKCLEKHICDTCTKELVNNELDSSSKLFCLFKGYDESKPFGGLLVPSTLFVNYITTIEGMFVHHLPNNLEINSIGKELLSKLVLLKLPDCPDFPSAYLLKLFTRMRLHYALKFSNRDLTSATRGKKNKKYFKIKHM